MLRASARRAAVSVPSRGLRTSPGVVSNPAQKAVPTFFGRCTDEAQDRPRAGLRCHDPCGQRRSFGTRQVSQKKKEARKSVKKGRKKGDPMDPKMLEMLKLVDEEPGPKPKWTEEEKQRNFEVGKRYNQMMAKTHNERMADYAMKVALRDDAIANLPELLQHAARQKDHAGPPSNRRIARYHPPVKEKDEDLFKHFKTGFGKKKEDADEDEEQQT